MSDNIKSYTRSEQEESQMGQETAGRFVEGKIRHDLIPPNPLDEVAKVYTYGCEKYDDDNWRKGMKWRKNVVGSLKRHIEKWLKGEKLDDESNCHHLAMAAWQCFCLMEYERCDVGQDDRNPYDLTLMNETEKTRRIKMWLKHASENTLDDYNGLQNDESEQN